MHYIEVIKSCQFIFDTYDKDETEELKMKKKMHQILYLFTFKHYEYVMIKTCASYQKKKIVIKNETK